MEHACFISRKGAELCAMRLSHNPIFGNLTISAFKRRGAIQGYRISYRANGASAFITEDML